VKNIMLVVRAEMGAYETRYAQSKEKQVNPYGINVYSKAVSYRKPSEA
jgi:hypothetical protein